MELKGEEEQQWDPDGTAVDTSSVFHLMRKLLGPPDADDAAAAAPGQSQEREDAGCTLWCVLAGYSLPVMGRPLSDPVVMCSLGAGDP